MIEFKLFLQDFVIKMTTYAKYADMYRQRLARSQDARVSHKQSLLLQRAYF